MIVAVFADVHGNLPALEAFVAAAVPIADRFLCLGDLVNYGPWGDECVDMVLSLPKVDVVQGNHDRLFIDPAGLEVESEVVRESYAAARPGFHRTDLLADLPVAGALGSFTAIHTIGASRIFPDTDLVPDGDYLIGHTHWQFDILRSGRRIVNPGSIGQNRQRIDRVSYALFNEESQEISLHDVPYDLAGFVSELKERKWPKSCVDYYERKWRETRERGSTSG